MIRFPIDIRVSLMKADFRLSPWQTKVLAMPTFEESEPEIMEYRYAHVHGILCFSPTLHGLTIIAIANDKPGDGGFASAMTQLERIAEAHGVPMIVGSIWNAQLRTHLKEKRGYVDCIQEGCEDAVIRYPSLT